MRSLKFSHLSTSLALWGSLTSSLLAADIPVSTHACDPDERWKSDLLVYMTSLNNPGNFDLGNQSFDTTTSLFGTGQNGFATAEETTQVETAWLMKQSENRPDSRLLNLPPAAFTLDYIQGGAGSVPAHEVDPQRFLVQPLSLSDNAGFGFLYAWEYDGNPYYQHAAMRNRAAMVLALDLIMIDQQHKTTDNAVTQNMGPAQIADTLDNYLAASIDTNSDCLGPWSSWTSCKMIPPDYQDPSLSGKSWDLSNCTVHNKGLWHPGAAGPQPPGTTNQALPGFGGLNNQMNNTYNFATTFSSLASTYYFIRPGLPTSAVSAFDEAFVRLAERLSQWGPFLWPPHFNRSTIGAPGLFLVQHMTGSPVAATAYEDYAGALYSGPNAHFDNAGFFRDDGGWDSNYNALNLLHTCRLARLEQDLGPTSVFADVTAACHQLSKLRAHLTIREPDGLYHYRYSPSHFNTRNSSGAHFGQYLHVAGPMNGMAVGDPWSYAQLSGWEPADYSAINLSGPSPLQVDLNQASTSANSATAALEAGRVATNHPWYVDNWTASCATGTLPPLPCYEGVQPWRQFNFGYYRPAYEAILHQEYHRNLPDGQPRLFQQWDLALQQNPDLERYPVERPGDSVEVFDNDFLFAKEGRLASMIHVGPVAGNGGGYGGGALSYLFEKDAGAVIYSRRRQPSGTGVNRDDPADWWRWALHTVWLQSTGGALTSAAGIPQPTSNLVPAAGLVNTSVAGVDGDIPMSYLPFGVPSPPTLNAPVAYKRKFSVDDDIVVIETTVGAGAAADSFTDVVETLPLNGLGYRFFGIPSGLGTAWEQSISVELSTPGGVVQAMNAQETWFDNVSKVVYRRLQGGIVITFDQPTRVKLADTYDFWYTHTPGLPDGSGSQTVNKTRNLVFDLLHRATGVRSGSGLSAPLSSSVAITYEITPFP